MNCPACKKELYSNQYFCSHCGQDLRTTNNEVKSDYHGFDYSFTGTYGKDYYSENEYRNLIKNTLYICVFVHYLVEIVLYLKNPDLNFGYLAPVIAFYFSNLIINKMKSPFQDYIVLKIIANYIATVFFISLIILSLINFLYD